MYRDERDAMLVRLDALSKTEQQNEAMRNEILELRRALATTPQGDPYQNGIQGMGQAEREMLGAHTLDAFPVWAAVLLHLCSFGLFSLIFYGIQQGNLPRAAQNDPTTGKAIGYQFIPFFNFYWMFFSPMRLCDRITLQYRLRGLTDEGPKGMALAAAVVGCIPYVNVLSYLVLWTVLTGLLQAKINKLVALGPVAALPERATA